MATDEHTRNQFRRYPQLAALKRDPDETDYEWQKRLGRERARLKRGDNIQLGAPKVKAGGSKKGFLPPEMAAELARREGETEADWKRRYSKAVMRRWRSDPEHKASEAERRREAYRIGGESDAKKAWRSVNADLMKEYWRRDAAKNKDKKLASLAVWNAVNADRMKNVRREYVKANRHIYAAAAAKIRAKAIQATPAWADWKAIQKIYDLARKLTRQTGIEHQVDHIVPLNGKHVRGLHVHYNLRVITATENMTKHNRFDPSLIEAA